MTEPETADSIKKHIEDFVNAAGENRKYVIDVPAKKQMENLYQIFLDKEHYRAIVSIYYGKKLSGQTAQTSSGTSTPASEEVVNEIIDASDE